MGQRAPFWLFGHGVGGRRRCRIVGLVVAVIAATVPLLAQAQAVSATGHEDSRAVVEPTEDVSVTPGGGDLAAGSLDGSMSTGGKVLILGTTVVGGASSVEATEAAALGYQVDIVTNATWSSMTTAQFSEYRAIILGDPNSTNRAALAAAEANTGVWGPAVNGNVEIFAGDPVGHDARGGRNVTRAGVRWAAAEAGKTGAYITLSEYYHYAAANTPVVVLDALHPGGFKTRGLDCADQAHIISPSPSLQGSTDASLSNWGCSVHAGFDAWPAHFGVAAISVDADGNFGGDDGTTGQPYVLVTPGGQRTSAKAGLGSGNAATNITQCSKVQPVNCATGNFWHTFSDLVVPGRGPYLDLNRTYNSSTAAQDGPFGHGWSSSYTMSAAKDPATGMVTVVQENGSRASFTRNGDGTYRAPSWVLATLVENPDGTMVFTRRQRERIMFSAAGRLTGRLDLNGYATNVSYPDTATVVVTDPAGRTLTLASSGGRVVSVTDTNSPPRVVRFAYDAAGNLAEATDANGGRTTFTYDAAHRVLTMREPNYATDSTTSPAPEITNRYDPVGRVDRQVDQLGRVTAFDYTAVADGTRITDPNGNVSTQTYANGALRSRTEAVGTPLAATWQYETDPATLGTARRIDPNGRVSTSTYDTRGNLTRTVDPLLRQSDYTYDTLNNLTSHTDPTRVATTLTYDTAGNLTSRSRPLTGTTQIQATTYRYEDPAHPGDVTTMVDPTGKPWTFTYDTFGNLTSATDPVGNKTTYAYDPVGRRTSQVTPRGNTTGGDPAQFTTTYTYDPAGRLTATTDPLGATTRSAYDANGNRTSVTDAAGRVTTTAYDPANQPVTVTRPDATTLRYGHDANGNQTSYTDGAGAPTTYAYDAANRQTTATDPLGRTTRYGYDKAGNRTTLTDPAGQVTTYGYDAADQLTSITYSDGTTPKVTLTYDGLGRRATMVDGTGTSTYAHDSLGRTTRSANGAGQAVSYGYDLTGRQTSLTYPDNQQVTRGYDDAGRLISVTDWTGKTTTFGHDADANHTTTTYPNGTTADRAFDTADRLSSVGHYRAGTTLADYTYTRNQLGSLTSTAASGVGAPSETYTYTPLDQLKTVNSATYDYDQADNLTRQASGATLSYDTANQATSYTHNGATSTLTYDARGNRTTLKSPSQPTTAYGYDQANRLTGVGGALEGLATTKGSVASGSFHNLAVKTDGTVSAWGDNGYGQLGDGTTTARPRSGPVVGLTGVVAVGAGALHSLALKSDGTVWAWGANGDGQLGNLTTTPTPTPVQVTGLSGVVAVASGGNHNLALKTDGTVWAWGRNNESQLGYTTIIRSTTPVIVGGLSGVAAVAAGVNHSLALKTDGTVSAWGANWNGQLGNGTTVNSALPLPVSDLTGAVAVAGGADHTLALKSDGTVSAWGSNGNGQLGDGTTTSSPLPRPVTGLTGAVAVTAGWIHSLAVKSDGTVSAWGNNGDGQLGDGTTTSRPLPGPVSELTGAVAVASIPNHSLALKSDGTASAWGPNSSGQLGDGTTTRRSTPVTVRANPSTSYTYNGSGLRATKTQPTGTTQYTWDESSGLPLLLKEGSTNYIYGPENTPVAQIDQTGTATYYHHDQLGSVRLLTDTTGTVVGTATYDAYGKPTTTTGTTTPFGYAGEYTDPETGFQYLRARYYDPTTSQFVTRDPLTDVSREPYGYAMSNPVNNTDPTGLWCPLGKNPNGSCRGSGAWDATGGKAVSYVDDHKVGILKGAALVLAVAAVPATGGTSLALGVGALGLSTAAELVDNKPCKSERVTQTLALGGVGLTVGVLWTGAGQAAKMGGDLASADVAGRIGSAFGAGDVLTNFLPSPECGC